MTSEVLINSKNSKDKRGNIMHFNNLNLESFDRTYFIKNSNSEVIRAWQAHEFEAKCFIPVQGSFIVAVVKIDNFITPSHQLSPKVYRLCASNPQALIVPAGYANGLKSMSNESVIQVFANQNLTFSEKNKVRFHKDMWLNWSKL